jgi:hypothetical protein
LGAAAALEEAATTLREAAAFVGAMGGPATMWVVWGTAGTTEGGHDGGGQAGAWRGQAAGRRGRAAAGLRAAWTGEHGGDRRRCGGGGG